MLQKTSAFLTFVCLMSPCFSLERSTGMCYATGIRNYNDFSTEILKKNSGKTLRGSDSVEINPKLVACNEMEEFACGFFQGLSPYML